MDFTEIYKQTASLVAFSPGAHFIATGAQDRLIVRRADSFQIARRWTVEPAKEPVKSASAKRDTSGSVNPTVSTKAAAQSYWITHIGWACDSEYIFAACARQGSVHVFKLQDEEWSCRIDTGVEGLVKVEWAPDGRSILCYSEWGLRITIWSLVTGQSVYIQYPLHPDRGHAFRADGRYFVVAERVKSKDMLGVYDVADAFKSVRHFQLPTSSLASLAISPTGNYIAVWEGPLEYKLHVLTLVGTLLKTFSPDPDPGYGIRQVKWHPTGLYLAVGGWDDRIHIIDSLTWLDVCHLDISPKIPAGVTVWREPSRWLEATDGRGFISYERLKGPHTVASVRPDLTRPPPKSGVVQLEWNQSGSLLLVRAENMNQALLLYRFPSPADNESTAFRPRLETVIINARPIVQARWNPVRKGMLAFCTGQRSLYTWSDEWTGEGVHDAVESEPEDMVECIGVPAQKFELRDLRWAPDGKGMTLLDRDTFCCAFEVEGE
ncbi:WD repeat-containing protein 8 [Fistulina hepatica ATCC 64428]|uniref:WD repeat-containing protein 8 n=1 Tax=Fistulina hepatica ATCC 64428 TaxID=1128425 RepID=A0A0D7AH14_9AGAR|nr:WD repeat-containing protein 8 [Fistulina hepatica ATCC 64428]